MNTALQCPRCGAPLPPPTTMRFACGYCRGALAITAVDELAPPPPRTLRLHDFGRSKIDAIRVIREITGFGLAEAKALSEQTPPVDVPVRVDDRTLSLALDALRPLGARWEYVDAASQRYASAATDAVTATAGEPEVELLGCGRNLISVIAAVREVTGLGLAQSKALCDRAPSRLRPSAKFTVEQAAQKLAAAGATVRVVGR